MEAISRRASPALRDAIARRIDSGVAGASAWILRSTNLLTRLARIVSLTIIGTALAAPQRTISPTLFHHSVHNAASGYWGIDRAHEGWTPDLMTFGKVMGGGLPCAAFGGRAEIMAHVAPEGGVYQAVRSTKTVTAAVGATTPLP